MKKEHFAALAICATLSISGTVAMEQNGGQPQVSVVNLQVVHNSDGSQSVITPKGDLAVLPGAGAPGEVAQIYFGSQGGFWYTDKTGKTIDLTPAVQALQARRAQSQQAAQQAAQPVPQYAPEYYEQAPVQQQVVHEESGGASALGTAAAAGAGAMLGTAMTNRYYNAPYGTPYYYGQNGAREFEDLNQNQKAVLYNKHQQNQQPVVDHRQANQQRNFQQQQDWYQNQLQQNPRQFQRGESNPFVAQGRESRGSSRRAERNGGGLSSRGDGGGLSSRGGGGGLSSRGGGGRSRGGRGR
jgi:hypothetical protein